MPDPYELRSWRSWCEGCDDWFDAVELMAHWRHVARTGEHSGMES